MSPSWDLTAAGTPARLPRAVPRHFARRRAMGRAKGDGFRRVWGVRVTDSGPKASPSRGSATAEGWACRGAPRGRSCTPREAPRGKLRATECSKGEVARHERRQGRRCHSRCLRGPFYLVGSHGSGHACTSPSGGSAALCAAADRGKHQRRRISPRTGPRVTDSGPKASPLRGPVAAEGGACPPRAWLVLERIDWRGEAPTAVREDRARVSVDRHDGRAAQ